MPLNRKVTGTTGYCNWELEIDCPGNDCDPADSLFDDAMVIGNGEMVHYILPRVSEVVAKAIEFGEPEIEPGDEPYKIEVTGSLVTHNSAVHARITIKTSYRINDPRYSCLRDQEMGEALDLMIAEVGFAVGDRANDSSRARLMNEEKKSAINEAVRRGYTPIEDLNDLPPGFPEKLRVEISHVIELGGVAFIKPHAATIGA